jgi:hypothetical protein
MGPSSTRAVRAAMPLSTTLGSATGIGSAGLAWKWPA